MAGPVGAAATDAIESAPDLSDMGVLTGVVAPWSCVGATATASDTALGMTRGGTVWHRIWVPKPGTVTVNDYPTAYLPPGESITAGDTYLYMYRGPADGSPLTDANIVSAKTGTWSNDDSAGGSKGLITVTEATGKVWYYICHTPYGNNPLANQWTYVTLPTDPTFRAAAGGAGGASADLFGGFGPMSMSDAAGKSSASALFSKPLNYTGVTTVPAAPTYAAYAGHSIPVQRGTGYTVASGSTGPTGPTGPGPSNPTTGQIWPRGVMPGKKI